MAIPEFVLQSFLDQILSFFMEKGKGAFRDAVTNKKIKDAIKNAASRFEKEYSNQDLAKTLCNNTTFYDLESIRASVRYLLEHPFDPAPKVQIEAQFKSVLPRDYGDVDTAASYFIERVQEELMSIEKLQMFLALIYEKRTAEASERTASGIENLVARQNISQSSIEQAKQKYLQFVTEINTHVDPRGILQGRNSIPLKLDEVYVSLTAENENYRPFLDRIYKQINNDVDYQSPSYKSKSVLIDNQMETERQYIDKLSKQLNVDVSIDAMINTLRAERLGDEIKAINQLRINEQRDLEHHLESMRELSHSRIFDLPRAIRENQRLIILGDPGTGKTTLLRFLANIFASSMFSNENSSRQSFSTLATDQDINFRVIDKDRNDYGSLLLPILIRIGNYADAFRNDRNLTMRTYILKSFADISSSQNSLQYILGEYLDSGEALVLLDGLDEVMNPSDRADIGRQIERFIATCHFHTHIVITSRISGYQEAPLAGDFSYFTLREFERKQIDKFLHRWFDAIERFDSPNTSICERKKHIDNQVVDILSAVDNNPGVRRLASNPLMLTILALIYRTGARLPSRRVELYELAVKTLLENWELARGIDRNYIVTESEGLRLLSPLAYWMQENRRSGIAQEREIKHQIALAYAKGYDKKQVNFEMIEKADDFFTRLLNTGVIVKYSEKYYGFIHLTFQDYFVAREIINRESPLQLIHEHRHESRWEEPILLAISFLSRDFQDKTQEMIRSGILSDGQEAKIQGYEKSKYEDILHRDLLYSIRAISDCVELSLVFTSPIIEDLLRLYFDIKNLGKYTSLRDQIPAILHSLRGTKISETIATYVLSSLSSQVISNRMCAIEVLGSLVVKNPDVINGLKNALNDEVRYVSKSAAISLGRLDFSDQIVLDGVLSAIRDKSSKLRENAIEVIGQLEIKNMLDIERLLLVTLTSSDDGVRVSAVIALVKLNIKTKATIDALIFLLKDKSQYVRYTAAIALGQLGEPKPEIIDSLFRILNDEEESVRESAMTSLHNLGIEIGEILSRLLHLLNDPAKTIRLRAVASLGQIGTSNSEVINSLLIAMNDEDRNIQTSAAAALVKIGIEYSNVVDRLLRNLKLSEYPHVQLLSARTLGLLSTANEYVVNGLLGLMKEEGKELRVAAANSIGKLVIRNPNILTNLLGFLKIRNENLRICTVIALGRSGVATQEIVDEMLIAIKNGSPELREITIEALGRLGIITPTVIKACIVALKDKNEKAVQIRAALVLGKILLRHSQEIDQNDRIEIQDTLYRLASDPRNDYSINIGGFQGPLYDFFWQALSDATIIL